MYEIWFFLSRSCLASIALWLSEAGFETLDALRVSVRSIVCVTSMMSYDIKVSRKRACQIRPRPRLLLWHIFNHLATVLKPGAHGKPIGCIALGKLGHRF